MSRGEDRAFKKRKQTSCILEKTLSGHVISVIAQVTMFNRQRTAAIKAQGDIVGKFSMVFQRSRSP